MPSIRLVEIHPILVHFPIALLLVSVLLDYLALFVRRAHLVAAAGWCLAIGTVGLVAAYLSGDLIEDHVNRAQAGDLLHMHKTFALMTVIAFITLLALRLIWLSPRMLSAYSSTIRAAGRLEQSIVSVAPILGENSPILIGLYLVGSLVAVILLSITGYLGGSMVYDHGVGMPSGSMPTLISNLLFVRLLLPI